MALKVNISIDQGTDFEATIDISNTFDLTNYTIWSHIRKNYTSSNYTEFETSHNGIHGQITLTLDHITTSEMEPGRYLYDVKIMDSNNFIIKIIEGIVTVSPTMTRHPVIDHDPNP